MDSREQSPWGFGNIRGKDRLLIYVERVVTTLKTGDYSIEGYRDEVTIERKSLDDLVNCCGKERARFEEEHRRLQQFGAGNSCVVVEANWQDVYKHNYTSQIAPKCVMRTQISWFARYGVPWFFPGSRRAAEIWAFRFFELWKKRREEHNGDQSDVPEPG